MSQDLQHEFLWYQAQIAAHLASAAAATTSAAAAATASPGDSTVLASVFRGPWEEWCAFAASHRISALPPDEYAAEQFIIEKAETTRSVASVETAVASINHFCARSKLTSPFSSPAFGLILRGICRDCGRLAVSRQPFTAGQIRLFLDLA
jgi:hypothetical protein